jgi:type IV pilus assembly protein PilA
MGWAHRRAQAGFTLIELMITVAIIGILASIALGQYRDYTRRAKMSEVVLAISNCKARISESFLSLPAPPSSGSAWGCDTTPPTRYATSVSTSADGAIRVTIANLDPAVNGLHMHLVPARSNGAALTAADVGTGVGQWLCGSDIDQVRNLLPSNCRLDTSPYADGTFE